MTRAGRDAESHAFAAPAAARLLALIDHSECAFEVAEP
jgi:hypothetical protein